MVNFKLIYQYTAINTLLKKLITGLTIPQQYVCLSDEKMSDRLSVNLTTGEDDISLDVTDSHLFLGYKPVIIGIVLSATGSDYEAVSNAPVICLTFHNQSFSGNDKWKGSYTDKKCVARLLLKKINEKRPGGSIVLFFEAVDGSHSFIHPLHQLINNQREKLRKNVPGNVSLPGKLHDMVRISYAIPRIISLITLTSGKNMNMFPTDLHGEVPGNFYISSLRKGGKANEQVEQLRKLAVSDIDALEYKFAYTLGKNHMQDLRSVENFNCAAMRSEKYDIPLPFGVTRYRELRQIESFDAGIHRIHSYEKAHEQRVSEGDTLSHIHQYYAQWRRNNGLPTDLLLR